MTDPGRTRGLSSRALGLGSPTCGAERGRPVELAVVASRSSGVYIWSVALRHTSRSGAMFGGCGLGAAISASEQFTGGRVVWATCQFVRFVVPPVDLRLVVTVDPASPRQVRVDALDGQRVAFRTVAAVGARSSPAVRQWQTPPAVVEPPLVPTSSPDENGTIFDVVEWYPAMWVGGDVPEGRSALWFRVPEGGAVSAPSLAIFGDCVSRVISPGAEAPMFSLDNTLRVGPEKNTEWVLAEVVGDVVQGDVAHGHVRLWSADGSLLAVASQTIAFAQQR